MPTKRSIGCLACCCTEYNVILKARPDLSWKVAGSGVSSASPSIVRLVTANIFRRRMLVFECTLPAVLSSSLLDY